MEIIDIINEIKKNPLGFTNEYALIDIQQNLLNGVISFSDYIKKSKKINQTKDELAAKLVETCEKLKEFYLQFYPILYRNSIVEINSAFFKETASSIHGFIKETIIHSKVLEDDDGLQYINYKEEDVEMNESSKFETLSLLKQLLEGKPQEEEIRNDDNEKKEEKPQRFKNKVQWTYRKRHTSKEDTEDEWNLDDLTTSKVENLGEDDEEDLDDIMGMFTNLSVSETKGFFKDSETKVSILELKTSDYLELVLPHTSDKFSMHFFYEYLHLFYLCNPNNDLSTSTKESCIISCKFGLSSLFFNNEKKFYEYTLQDLYNSLLHFVDMQHLLFKFTNAINTNKTFQETTTKKDVINEAISFINSIYMRLWTVINSNDENLINVDIFKHCVVDEKTKKKNFMVNTCALYYFSHAYRMIFSTLELDKYFFPNKNKSKIKIRDFSNKYEEDAQLLKKDFEKYISKYKGRKKLTNGARWFTYRMCSSTLNRDWHIYQLFNSDISEQLATVEIIRDTSKIQRKVIELYEPTYNKWLSEIWKSLLFDITLVTEKNKKDERTEEKIKKALEDVIKNKEVPENTYSLGVKMEFRNMMNLYTVHLWFISTKGYKFWLFRYFIPFEAFLRYGFMLMYLILEDKDNIYREPFIIQYGQFEYAVLSGKQLFYCGSDSFKALHLWLNEMYVNCSSTISPIKPHGEMKKMECYYPWIYVWKKIYFAKDFSIMEFLSSLSDDTLEVGEVFYVYETSVKVSEEDDKMNDMQEKLDGPVSEERQKELELLFKKK